MADNNATTTTAPTTTPADLGGSGDADPGEPAGGAGGQAGDGQLGEAGERALQAERAARQNLERELRATRKQLETANRQGMTDADRAVAEAESRGRTAAAVQFGEQLARSEFATEAARINPTFDVASIGEDVNWRRFVAEDGTRDSSAIKAAVQRLVPAGNGGTPPSFDGGNRGGGPQATSMNEIIRNAANRRR